MSGQPGSVDNSRAATSKQSPRYDAALAVHRIIEAEPEVVFDAARDLDFMTVHTPLVDAAFFVRGLPARLRGRLAPAPAHAPLNGTPGEALPGWVVLGERAGEEIAFGAIGVFWRGEITWENVEPADFASFAEPGHGKIACNFSVRPYGPERTILTFDCRVATTDGRSHRGFVRYWTIVRPFVGHIMRAALATVAADVARQSPVI